MYKKSGRDLARKLQYNAFYFAKQNVAQLVAWLGFNFNGNNASLTLDLRIITLSYIVYLHNILNLLMQLNYVKYSN